MIRVSIFSIGEYILHQKIDDVVNSASIYQVFQANGTIVAYKIAGGQFALSGEKPILFQV